MDTWLIAGGFGAALLVGAAYSAAWLVQRRRYERGDSARKQGEGVLAARVAQPSEHPVTQRRELAHLARVSMVGELSGAIAHELNQPLTAILSNAQAAQRMLNAEQVNPREVYDILTDIVAEDKRAVLVIERLRALLTKEQTDAQVVDPALLVQEVLALAHSTLVAGKVTVAASLSSGVPAVLADRVQIQQVLLNLILNASEAMSATKDGAQRQLSIATTLANDGAVLVTVSDTGAGIPADTFDRLFDSFYTTKSSGLGLGLSISKTIVEAHGGRIWAVNNPGAGATFCFTLPPAARCATPAQPQQTRGRSSIWRMSTMNEFTRSALRGALGLIAVVAVYGCAHEPPAPIVKETTVDVTATVEAVDRQSRMVALRTSDGRTAAVYAGPSVRNFDQINTGDQVVVSYYEAIGAEVTTPEQATQGVQEESAEIRAAKGARPAGAIADTLTTTVEIESVDASLNTVTFRRADGMTRTLAIEDQGAQAFIRKLKRGDLVQVTYMEAVAVAVRPAG